MMIKRTATQLMPSFEFSESFEVNKKILGNTMPSKSIRNKIAGYIARLVRQQKHPKVRVENDRIE